MRRLGCADFHSLLRVSVDEPDRFWPAVVDDLGLEFSRPWERGARRVARGGVGDAGSSAAGSTSRGTACTAGRAARARRRSGSRRTAAGARSRGPSSRARCTYSRRGSRRSGIGEGDVVGTFLPMAPEVAIASHALRAPRRGAGADLLGVRRLQRSRRGSPTPGATVADHRGRLAAPRPGRADEGDRRRGAADGAVGASTSSSGGGSASDVPMAAGRDVWWDELVAGRTGRRRAGAGRLARRRTCSRTPPARPGGRRARSTCRAASSSRSPREAGLPGRPPRRATASTSPPTWAGSWGRGPWSARGAAGRRSSTRRARPTGPHDRLWRLVESERRDDARRLADAGARADPAGRAGRRPLLAAGDRDDRRAVEPRAVPLARPSMSAAAASRSSTSRAAPRSAPASSRRCIVEPIKPCSRWDSRRSGMAMDVFDADGRPVRGEVGELVCTRPWPGMTRGIWGDPERYLDTYWRRFPGVWSARRLGLGRRGRLLVPARALGRHAEHRRQADRPGRARVGGRVASATSSRPAAIGVPHEVKGEVAGSSACSCPGASPTRREIRGRRRARSSGRRSRPSASCFVTALPEDAVARRSSGVRCGRRRSDGIRATSRRREPGIARRDQGGGRWLTH